MAVPLAATLQPLEVPFPLVVGAEIMLLYPTDQAEAVAVDGYIAGFGQEATVYPGGMTFKESGGTETLPPELCSDLQVVGTSGCGFTSVAGESTLLLSWNNVSHFFWWFPDGQPVDDTYAPPPPSESVDVGTDCPPSLAVASPLCPPSTIITLPGDVADAPTRWDEEGAVWDGEGVWLS